MKKKNLMKSLTALVLSVLMVLSLAACGAKPSDGGKDEDKDGYTVAIIKQMDHASLDEIADAIAARLDAIAQEQNVSIRYTITSGQGDQSVLKQLADQVSFVTQDNFLFDCSLKENIRLGKPDATEEEIIQAAKDAQAYDFIMALPDGFDTMLTQGGTNVSGGQKQRLCIARAMLRKPAVLILDDSTSAVDSATEAAIRESFAKNLKDTTVIIIAQRISSVQYADEILILEDDHIAAHGTHDELLKSSPIYQEIYQSQQEGVGE